MISYHVFRHLTNDDISINRLFRIDKCNEGTMLYNKVCYYTWIKGIVGCEFIYLTRKLDNYFYLNIMFIL